MNPSSSSSSLFSTSFDDEAESSKMLKNDVFMNYSFEDIGNSFISHLKGALNDSSFTISDPTMLPIGKDAPLELSKAIEESEIYVVVFSPNYASSTRCLDELVDIMDSFSKFDERKVLPVFYEVDPSHVRNQKGPFMEAFQAHNTNIHPNRVERWRKALKDAGQLSGHTSQNRDEAKLVLKIVKELVKMQRPQELHVTDHPVGIGSRAEELISTLRLDLKDQVLVVAVFGISGIGKTTIVKEAFNRIAPSFDLSIFLADIHYMCQVPNWKVELQKALLSCLTRENKFSIMSNHNEGVTKIRRLVSHRKILLALDDIDNFQQLESLGICPKWFSEGSRIIVTTRDKGSLGNIPYASYHTKLLNRRESLNLFTRLMFASDDPINIKFIQEVVGRAGGLPLVLKVWSSHFKQYEREQWPSILETLKGIPHGDVQKQLRLSYDSLTNRCKKLFLDIACFFVGAEKDFVVKVLQDEDSRFFPSIEIKYLVDKNLVEITPYNKLWMHHAIREMGCEIVRQENEDEPGQRTRLWDQRDVIRVLTECSGTESVESIMLRQGTQSVESIMQEEVTLEAFRKMSNLRLIHFQDTYSGIFSHDEMMTHLCFKKLKYMVWYNFPCRSFDSIDMGNIVVLIVIGSKLEMLWTGIKSLKKLRILDVSHSLSLTKTGNFSGLENLEELYLGGCTMLQELHCSIGCLKKLAILDLRQSIPLNRIPWEMIRKLASLRKLILGQPSFSNEVNDNLVSLKMLDLSENTFSSLPDSLSNLLELVSLDIEGCEQLRWLPLLPPNFTYIHACACLSLDVRSFGSIRIKAQRKESPCSRRFVIRLSFMKMPDWCSYQSRGDFLSFVAPVHLDNNIYGIILFAHIPDRSRSPFILKKMYNKTKNISHRFVTKIARDDIPRSRYNSGICVTYYPLDDTTLSVEPGDSVVLRFHRGLIRSCGLHLIYETDVVDGKLVFPTASEPIPHVPLEMPGGITQLNAISNDSHSDDYSSSDDEDEFW